MPLSAVTDRRFAEAPLGVRELGLLILQLVLLTVLSWQFHLEEKRHLFEILTLASVGFVVHALLPAKFRRAWFVMLSIAAIVLVLGSVQAAYVVVIGVVLIAAALAPFAFWWRVLLVVGVAGCCVCFRSKSEEMFWPIVGSMFMFRMLVYLQDVQSEPKASTWLESISYFFLLPNSFFPLFPVVDHRTFRESYYNDDRLKIYQTGVHWIVTGLAHLLIYRVLKYEFLPTPLEIHSDRSIVLFLAVNYALYVRISGQFHIICGMLHLFGFNLPRTHNLYFLATSSSDVWQRINIYWKDFMLKSFFYPAYFRLRGFGTLTAIVLAVMWVFFWTWLAHSWQSFWLLGRFPFRIQEAALWMVVGLLEVVNATTEYYRVDADHPPNNAFSFPGASLHVLKIMCTFSCVSLFWAEWSHPEILTALLYSITVLPVTSMDVIMLCGTAVSIIVIGVAIQYACHHAVPASHRGNLVATLLAGGNLTFDQSVRIHLLPMVCLLLIAQPPIAALLGQQSARKIAGIQIDKVRRADALAMIDGYYEELNDQTAQAGPFLGDPERKRTSTAVDFTDISQFRPGLPDFELIPNWKGTLGEKPLTTNRWGMRNRDCSLAKPAETYRIAVIGSSLVMGYGVADDQTFCFLMEGQLNRLYGSAHRHYEVLNFGVGRYCPLDRRAQLEGKVMKFNPDLVVYVAHQDEVYSSTRTITGLMLRGIDVEDRCLDDVIRASGWSPKLSQALVDAMVSPYNVQILKCIYRRLHRISEENRVNLVYAYLPIPGEHDLPFDPLIGLTFAKEAGLKTVDLSNWWGDRSANDVLLSPTDYHGNVLGNQMMADAFVKAISGIIDRN